MTFSKRRQKSAIKTATLQPKDWATMAAIYQEGIDTGNATFETRVPSWEDWDRKHLASCRFVAREKEDIVGWIALGPISSRAVYRGVAEVSVYITSRYRGRGVGKILLRQLIEESERQGF